MKLCVCIPPLSEFSGISKIMESDFPDITPTYFQYNNYKEVVPFLTDHQSNYDGIIFAGSAPYDYANYYLKQKIPWGFIDRYSGSIFRALLQARLWGCDISKVSFDYVDMGTIGDIYKEIHIPNQGALILSYKELCKKGLSTEKYNEEVYQFHMKNYQSHKANCIVTPCHDAFVRLKENNIPTFFAYPTRDTIYETVRRLYSSYIAKKNQKSQIVILSVEIDLPNEYSLFMQNETAYMQEKAEIASYIYAFAEKISATVVEATYRNYLMFTTKSILDCATDHLTNFSLLKQIDKYHMSSLSIGIGYGQTVTDAKENANIGLLRSKEYKSSNIFVVYDDHIPRGPLINTEPISEKNMAKVNSQILNISNATDVSMQNIFKLYHILATQKKDVFTVKALAEEMQISRRSVDRIVNKLESSGYAEVIGQQAAYDIGRPSRVIRISLKM